MGQTTSQEQIAVLQKSYPEAEISMLDVQQAARQLEIQLEGIKSTLAELEKKRQPFIALLPNHFVFVERVEGDWGRLQEQAGFVLERRASFEAKYQGKALLTSVAGLECEIDK